MSEEPVPLSALPVVIPTMQEWEFSVRPRRGPGEPEIRKFWQSELSLDGEVYLMKLVQKAGQILIDNGITPSVFADLEIEGGAINWPLALDLITKVAEQAPAVLSEAASILVGYYPTRRDGTPDPEFAATAAWLREALNSSRVLLMVQTFIGQNDYLRLAGPFVAALNRGIDLGNRVRAAETTKREMDGQGTGDSPEPLPSSPPTGSDLPSSNGEPSPSGN